MGREQAALSTLPPVLKSRLQDSAGWKEAKAGETWGVLGIRSHGECAHPPFPGAAGSPGNEPAAEVAREEESRLQRERGDTRAWDRVAKEGLEEMGKLKVWSLDLQFGVI